MTPTLSTTVARIRWFRVLTLGPKVVIRPGFSISPGPAPDDELVVSIGARSTLGKNLRVTGFGEFAVGYRTTIGDGFSCDVAGQLAISDEVTIGNGVTFHADRTRRTFVGDGVVIGDGATIGGGVVLDDGARVEPGATVTVHDADVAKRRFDG